VGPLVNVELDLVVIRGRPALEEAARGDVVDRPGAGDLDPHLVGAGAELA
jgi:hypothetical protein